MSRNSLIITALLASSIGLSGCSSVWDSVGDRAEAKTEKTNTSFLRGFFDFRPKSEIARLAGVDVGVHSFAEADIPQDVGATYIAETSLGRFSPPIAKGTNLPTQTQPVDAVSFDNSLPGCPDGTYLTEDNACMFLDSESVTFDANANDANFFNTTTETAAFDTSQPGCPEGTFLTEENACMFFDSESVTFDASVNNTSLLNPITETAAFDTSQPGCPDGTYLTEDNSCMFFDTEDYDLGPLNQEPVFVDTSPIPCPEGTYLAGENECRSLETDTFDFAQDPPVGTDVVTPIVTQTTPVQSTPTFDTATACPEGFQETASGQCQYKGAELQNAVDLIAAEFAAK